MNKKRIVTLCVLSMLAASSSWANDFLFSLAALPVVGLALLGWLIAGTVVRIMDPRLFFLGPGILVAVFFGIFLFFHLELILMVWMIYLALLVVYFAFPRKEIDSEVRRVNLQFHGAFLGIVIVGGILAKIIYWHSQGGFAAWMEWMEEFFLFFVITFGFIAAVTFVFFRSSIRRKIRKLERLKAAETDS